MSCYLCGNGTKYGIKSLKMPQEDPLPKMAESGKDDPAAGKSVLVYLPKKPELGNANPAAAEGGSDHVRPPTASLPRRGGQRPRVTTGVTRGATVQRQHASRRGKERGASSVSMKFNF